MQINKNIFRNPNIYTATSLILVFIYLSGLLPGNPMPISITNPALNFLTILIFIMGAGSSLAFILMKLFGR